MWWFPFEEPLCRRSGDRYRWHVRNVVAALRSRARARVVRFAGGLTLCESVDLFGDELGVVLDPAEERGPAPGAWLVGCGGVLPLGKGAVFSAMNPGVCSPPAGGPEPGGLRPGGAG